MKNPGVCFPQESPAHVNLWFGVFIFFETSSSKIFLGKEWVGVVKGTVCERQKKRLHDLAGREKGADQLSQSILLGAFRRTAHNTSSIGAWVVKVGVPVSV